MKIFRQELSFRSTSDIDIMDITDEIANVVEKSRIENGQVMAHIAGSTASISTIEYEPGAVRDLKETLEKIAPKDKDYHHHKTWNDGNGYSHVLASMLGCSRCFPLVSAYIELGTWQQIILIDLDNKPRNRKVLVQVMGE